MLKGSNAETISDPTTLCTDYRALWGLLGSALSLAHSNSASLAIFTAMRRAFYSQHKSKKCGSCHPDQEAKYHNNRRFVDWPPSYWCHRNPHPPRAAPFRNSPGNFAIFTAIRRASSLLSNLAVVHGKTRPRTQVAYLRGWESC